MVDAKGSNGSKMIHFFEPIFEKIDSMFTRDGQLRFETRFSRWIKRLVSRHLFLGTLFESVLLSIWIMIGIYILFRQITVQTLIVQGVLTILSVIWLSMYHVWHARKDSQG
jgi:hypothetical protein